MDLNHQTRLIRVAWLGFTTTYKTYKTAGTAKHRVSRTRHRILWVGLWFGNSLDQGRKLHPPMQHRPGHFLDGLWLDNAYLHSCPHGSRERIWRERQHSPSLWPHDETSFRPGSSSTRSKSLFLQLWSFRRFRLRAVFSVYFGQST